jgi:hypothetical protein
MGSKKTAIPKIKACKTTKYLKSEYLKSDSNSNFELIKVG